jgi:hypothetical protein
MPKTLAEINARVLAFLFDDAGVVWTAASGVVTECIRLALHEYTNAAPLGMETVLTTPDAGREIALDGLDGLVGVHDVWWPYSTTASEEWPPNRVEGWRLFWDDARPVLVLSEGEGDQPAKSDGVRIWYTKMHTVSGLDSAAVTSVPDAHASILVMGAAGFACFARAQELAETATQASVATPNYAAMASRYLKQFRVLLNGLRIGGAAGSAGGEPWGAGWALDKYDARGE